MSFLGVRSFSFTVLFSLFMLQYSALSEVSMNFSVSKVSWGIWVGSPFSSGLLAGLIFVLVLGDWLFVCACVREPL